MSSKGATAAQRWAKVKKTTLFEESSHLLGLGLRKGILFHEINAGQPCFKCGDKCPGFELHFWRKSCIHCKCSPFSHESADQPDEAASEGVGRISDTIKGKFSLQTSVASQQRVDELRSMVSGHVKRIRGALETSPSKESRQVASGSRRVPQQPHQQYQQGVVQGQEVPQQGQGQAEHVQGRASGGGTVMYASSGVAGVSASPSPAVENERLKQLPARQQQHTPREQQNQRDDVVSGAVHEVQASELQVESGTMTVTPQDAQGIPAYPQPTPYKQQQQQQQQQQHDGLDVVSGEAAVREGQAIVTMEGEAQQGEPTADTNVSAHQRRTTAGEVDLLGSRAVPELRPDLPLAWKPDGVTDEEAMLFFQEPYPLQEVPVEGTDGERRFLMELEEQLPAHDFDPAFCSGLTPEGMPEFEAVLKLKVQCHQLGQVSRAKLDTVCFKCREPLPESSLQVTMEAVPGERYHPWCFRCNQCDHLLAGLNAFIHDESVLCERHFSDKYKARCAACDESIYETEFLQAEGQAWHVHHFCCFACDKPVHEDPYVPLNGQPHCSACFNKQFVPQRKNKLSLRRPPPKPPASLPAESTQQQPRQQQDQKPSVNPAAPPEDAPPPRPPRGASRRRRPPPPPPPTSE